MTIIVTRAGKGSPLTNNEMDANLNNLNTQGGVITTVASATTPDIFAVSVGRVIDYTGTATATGFVAAPQAGMEKELLCAGAAVFTAGANFVIAGTASASNYTAVAGDRLLVVAETTTKFRMYALRASGAASSSAGSRQVFLTGTAATYTTPANCRRIVVRMKGPGGSTHGSSTSADGGGAGAGTATSFNSITAAVGGNSGQASGGKPSGGSGGTGGTGTASLRIAGAMGHAQTTPYATGTTAYLIGGNGGGTGGGLAKDPTAYGTASGSAGVANSGGGASGAGLTTALLFASASGGWVSGGGGEGEYAEITISSPAGTYTYTVGTAGAGGTAGTSGAVGAAGGSGFIYVDEYY